MKTTIAFLLLATTTLAAEPKVHRDLPYAEPKNERHMLDVYAPTEGKDHPIIVWIHGGGWRFGNKTAVQQKPQAFVDKGFVFVSTNYRFAPQVSVKEMTADIATAIKWVHEHAKDYGGDTDTIFVAGHSAGAHLAALVCTDERYLKAEGLSLANIKGCFPVDTAAYDVPKQVAGVGGLRSATYTGVFGSDVASQKELSPITFVGKEKHIPPFCLLHVADRPDSTAQSKAFAKALQNAGVDATVVPGEGKTHGTINSELGLPDDKPTKAVWEFLDGVLKSRTLENFKAKLDTTFTPAKAELVFGKPDRNVGSGLIIYEYDLSDGSKLRLGFPGFAPIMYAKHLKQDGTTEDLPLK
jgi:arylformamidase